MINLWWSDKKYDRSATSQPIVGNQSTTLLQSGKTGKRTQIWKLERVFETNSKWYKVMSKEYKHYYSSNIHKILGGYILCAGYILGRFNFSG